MKDPFRAKMIVTFWSMAFPGIFAKNLLNIIELRKIENQKLNLSRLEGAVNVRKYGGG